MAAVTVVVLTRVVVCMGACVPLQGSAKHTKTLLLAADSNQGGSLDDALEGVSPKVHVVLVFGHETRGVPDKYRSLC